MKHSSYRIMKFLVPLFGCCRLSVMMARKYGAGSRSLRSTKNFRWVTQKVLWTRFSLLCHVLRNIPSRSGPFFSSVYAVSDDHSGEFARGLIKKQPREDLRCCRKVRQDMQFLNVANCNATLQMRRKTPFFFVYKHQPINGVLYADQCEEHKDLPPSRA